jgi:hypothetical protein
MDFTSADTRVSTFAVWTPKGWAADWDGEVIYNRKLENAALFTLAAADDAARRLNGCVYDTERNLLLTLAERKG